MPSSPPKTQAQSASGSLPSDELTADQSYPQEAGYDEFIKEHAAALDALCVCKDDESTKDLLLQNLELLLSSGHVGRWFMLRHSDMLQAGGAGAVLQAEARQFFILDCACDAANAYFMRMHGQFAQDRAHLLSSAAEGVKMCFAALQVPDPIRARHVKDRLAHNVRPARHGVCHPVPSGSIHRAQIQAYVRKVVMRVKRLREDAKEAERLQQETREKEAAIESEAAADEAARARAQPRASLRRMVTILCALLMLFAAMGMAR